MALIFVLFFFSFWFQGVCLGSLSEIDDLASTFAKVRFFNFYGYV
jgi:hypothetical protein